MWVYRRKLGLLALVILGYPAIAHSQNLDRVQTWPRYYVRGEAAGAALAGSKGTWIGPGVSDPRVFHRLSKRTTFFAGFATGMEARRGIRLEVGYFHLFRARVNGQWIYTLPVVPGPHADMQTRFSSNIFFLNGYVHPLALMGVDWPIQPFVGGGAGAAFNAVDAWIRTNPAAGNPLRVFERGDRTQFAWNLAGGISVDAMRWIGFPLTLDITYRYIDLGRARGSVAPYDVGNIPREAFNYPVRAHVYSVGVRIPVGLPGGGNGFAFSPARNFMLPQMRNGGRHIAICDSVGPGFYLIPGTDTCLSVGGSVRFETAFMRSMRRTDDTTGMTARAQVSLDARTPTPYGLLQSYLRLEMNSSSGVFSGLPGTSLSTNVDRAFIRFGGLVFGRLPSMFDFYSNALNFSSIGGSDTVADQVSYAMDIGAGYTAGIGVESNSNRTSPNLTDYFFSRRPALVNLNAGQLLNRSPNVVAAARYDGTGLIAAAQVSAAAGEVRAVSPAAFSDSASQWGFAIQAGLRLRLPVFAASDSLWLQAAYAHGSLSYLGADRVPMSLGNLLLPQADGTIIQGKMTLTRGYALTAAFVHRWTPSVSQAVYGSIVNVNYPSLAQVAAIYDTRVLQAGTSLVWSPVSGFQLGGELLYSRVDPQGSVIGLNGLAKDYVSQVSLRLRALRQF